MKETVRVLLLTIALLTTGASGDVLAQNGPSPGRLTEVEPQEPYVLTAAYPNPFKGSTRFNLTVRQRQQVKVQVFNMLGQPVRELYAGTMDAGETKTFIWDAGDLPSGIYIYRVRGENFTAARQITLMR